MFKIVVISLSLYAVMVFAKEPTITRLPATIVCTEEVVKTGPKSKDNPGGHKVTKTTCMPSIATPTPSPKPERTARPSKSKE